MMSHIDQKKFALSLSVRGLALGLEILLIIVLVPKLVKSTSPVDLSDVALGTTIGVYLFLAYLGERLYHNCLQGSIRSLRLFVFDELGKKDTSALAHLDRNRLIYQLDQDCSHIPKGFMKSQDLIIDTVLLAINFVIIFHFSTMLFFTTLGAAGLVILLAISRRASLKHTHDQLQDSASEVHSLIRFGATHPHQIMRDGMWLRVSTIFSERLGTRLEKENAFHHEKTLISAVFSLIASGYVWVLINSSGLSSVAGVSAVGLFLRLIPRLFHVQKYLILFQTAQSSLHSIENFLGRLNAAKLSEREAIHSIELKSANFLNNGEELFQKPVDLVFQRNRFYGMIGASGTGKSVLIEAIAGFRVPEQGTILVNSKSEISSAHAIQLVSLRAPIYPLSVRENIILQAVYKEDRFNQITERCGISRQWLDQDSLSLDHLSQGERQRLILARAIYQNPNVLLVDEGLSSLDFILEAQMLSLLREEAASRIVILITHRVELVRGCQNLVMVEDEGVQSGSWDELMKKQGSFLKLFSEREGLKVL